MATQKLCVTFWSNVPANVFNKGYVPARLATGYHVLMRSDDEIQLLSEIILLLLSLFANYFIRAARIV